MSECSCYHKYPNPAHKLKNGKWICVDRYKCVHDLELKDDDKSIIDNANFYHYVKHKTKCVYKEEYIMKKGKDKFLEAIHTIEEFCWQFRPDCDGCPLANHKGSGQVVCAIRSYLPYSEREVRKRIEEWEHEKR